MENSNEKSFEKTSRNFLEYTGLKVGKYLEDTGYGVIINIAVECEIEHGQYFGDSTLEFVISNCNHIEVIIPNISEIIGAEFSKMIPANSMKYCQFSLVHEEYNCYLFIFEKHE
jgi:hypothetical protein